MTFAVICLAILDLGILLGFFYYFKKNQDHAEVLEALTEERVAMKGIKEEILGEINEARQKTQKQISRFQQLAAEVEQDAKNGKDLMKQSLEELLGEFSRKLEEPLRELSRRQNSLEQLLKKAARERLNLSQSLQKGESLSRFFNKEIPYEDLLKDIELKKYEDARKLIGQGYPPDQIARELGMRTPEIELLKGMNAP